MGAVAEEVMNHAQGVVTTTDVVTDGMGPENMMKLEDQQVEKAGELGGTKETIEGTMGMGSVKGNGSAKKIERGTILGEETRIETGIVQVPLLAILVAPPLHVGRPANILNARVQPLDHNRLRLWTRQNLTLRRQDFSRQRPIL